jgi:hypothetical protein
MELVALLRTLWRFRIAVAVGAVVAVALGFLAIRGSSSSVGVGSMRVLIDTPTSQTVDAESPALWWLTRQAELLADLTSAAPTRQRVAREMRIPADSLAITTPSLSVPPARRPLSDKALQAATAVDEPYQLAIQGAPLLPIIGIDATAPNRAEAARLLTAAANALKAESAVDAAPGNQFVVEDIGPVRARKVVTGPGRIIAVLVAVVAFGVWCTCITVFAGVARARRRWLRAVAVG